MFATVRSDSAIVHPNGGVQSFTLTPQTGQQIISCGWQNLNGAKNVYASQCFVQENGASAYIELVNNGVVPVDTWAYVTVYMADPAGAANS